jgi:uncharacterized membrane protein YbhN (UPF0104 family)
MILCRSSLDMKVSVWELWKINLIASFYSLFLPGDLAGGSVSWFKLYQKEHKAIEAGLLLVHFRIVSTFMCIVLGLLAVFLDQGLTFTASRPLAIILFLIFLVVLIPFSYSGLNRLVVWSAGIIPYRSSIPSKIRESASILWDSIVAYQSLGVGTTLSVFGLSFLSQLLGVLRFYLIAKAVGIALPVIVITWVQSFLYILNMIPVSISGLGIREASLLILLEPYQIPGAQAISFSLVIYAATVIVGLLGGLMELMDLSGGNLRPVPKVRVQTNNR